LLYKASETERGKFVVKRNVIVVATMVVVVAGLLMLARYRMSGGGAASVGAITPGSVAPDFALRDLQGNTVRLSELRGKAVVLNFWATWCGPCQREIPWFVDIQKEYGKQGLQVVGVSMDWSDPKDVLSFAGKHGMNYPVVFGDEHVADAYGGIAYLPTTFYIDRNGAVVNRVFGEAPRKEIERNVQRTIAVPSKPLS
jgi:peroxiredoxin